MHYMLTEILYVTLSRKWGGSFCKATLNPEKIENESPIHTGSPYDDAYNNVWQINKRDLIIYKIFAVYPNKKSTLQAKTIIIHTMEGKL